MSGEGVSAEALGLAGAVLKPLYQKIAKQLELQRAEGSAGGGAVRVVLSGKQEVIEVSVAPEAAGDAAALEKLVYAAVESALKRSHELIKRELKRHLGAAFLDDLS